MTGPLRVGADVDWVDLPIDVEGELVTARMFTFAELRGAREHFVLGLGPYQRPPSGAPLVRVHSECLTGEVLGSLRCDCGPQLREAIARISVAGGYLAYLRQEGRGIGLYSKLDAYRLQDDGLDTFEANRALGFDEDAREFGVAARMLLALGARRIDLITGNEQKVRDLVSAGVAVRRTVPTACHQTAENVHYLDAKRARGFQFGSTSGLAF